jgi:small subunit ribosomal protein S6
MERRQNMRDYELYLVLDTEADEATVSGIIERVTQVIVRGDGKTAGQVIKVDPRGKRRLAYPVKRKVEAQDILLTFQTSSRALPEIERILKLTEQVLRYLIVRIGEE